MSTEDNKAVVRQLYEAVNQGLLTILDAHPGLTAVKASLQHAYALAPNLQATYYAAPMARGSTYG